MSFNRIRFKFLYVCLASMLVSAVSTMAAFQIAETAFKLALHRSPYQFRPIRWLIEHVGATPFALAFAGLIFILLFYWRSGKIKDDMAANGEGELQ
ncbi:hypothetical protein [Paenibacillus silvisoli]|uniref:hypothetical protein n=1 Tax=Paenibacillus silvisoli TaxID=3110539 RepID=UPI002803FB75|nr:hypothetical protein [Paenibacillus silvisoli]